MDKHNENTTHAPQQDVIVLGVASIDTLGPGGIVEPTGMNVSPGIAED